MSLELPYFPVSSQADTVIELGPGAGAVGGEIVAMGAVGVARALQLRCKLNALGLPAGKLRRALDTLQAVGLG